MRSYKEFFVYRRFKVIFTGHMVGYMDLITVVYLILGQISPV